MLESEAFCSKCMVLGSGWEVPGNIIFDVERFVCALYGQKDSSCINVARYILFRLTCLSENMPPNHDSLKHDIAGVNYQTAIHRRCPERFIDAPSAVGHGWQVEDGQLVHKWMDNSPAQQSVLKSINCKRKKSGCKDTCSCLNLSDLFICKSQESHIFNTFFGGKLPQKLMCNIFLLFGVA